MRFLKALTMVCVIGFCCAASGWAQSGGSRPTGTEKKRNQRQDPTASGADQSTGDDGAIKVDTNLVTVPIIASDRNNKYLTDLAQDELQVFEDDKPQQIAFFANTSAPFNVILMLDTSASAEAKLGQIRRAAIDFVEQLQPEDHVMVMSFDNNIRTLAEFTNQRQTLRMGINDAQPGQGTKLYDAMDVAVAAFAKIQGRKAIVIFTDGVDSYSDHSNYYENKKRLEEAGIIVYPIRYDTRAELEARMRQAQTGGQQVDLGSILGGHAPGRTQTTPGTFPGAIPSRPPVSGGGGTGGGSGGSTGGIRIPDMPGGIGTGGSTIPTGGTQSGGTAMPSSGDLNQMYQTADQYLTELASVTGGELNRADDLGVLPTVFARIAAELRTQYSLGYYPANSVKDGQFHKLKVKTTRKGAVIRARPGYRSPAR